MMKVAALASTGNSLLMERYFLKSGPVARGDVPPQLRGDSAGVDCGVDGVRKRRRGRPTRFFRFKYHIKKRCHPRERGDPVALRTPPLSDGRGTTRRARFPRSPGFPLARL